MGGVLGYDMTAVLLLADGLGHDPDTVALLMPYVERGLISAINRRQEETD